MYASPPGISSFILPSEIITGLYSIYVQYIRYVHHPQRLRLNGCSAPDGLPPQKAGFSFALCDMPSCAKPGTARTRHSRKVPTVGIFYFFKITLL